jgi:hypothetical protein
MCLHDVIYGLQNLIVRSVAEGHSVCKALGSEARHTGCSNVRPEYTLILGFCPSAQMAIQNILWSSDVGMGVIQGDLILLRPNNKKCNNK